ncbi:hypothetical protein C8R46DRAFT_1065707 [Mycena filopes]|nr:hypothetical protein C8R46DRAFT_1065707 [Mycena filopes]
MKSDPTVDDPLDVAEARLAHAFAEAKGALVDVRNKPSPLSIALAASERKCRNLEAGMAKMKRTAMTQTQALAHERSFRAAADRRFADLDYQMQKERVALHKEREALKLALDEVEGSKARCTAEATRLAHLESQMTEDQVALTSERDALRAAQTKLVNDKATLKNEKNLLKAAQTKLVADRRAALTNFKRSLAEMEGLKEAMEEGLEEVMRPAKRTKTGAHTKTTPKPTVPRTNVPQAPGPPAMFERLIRGRPIGQSASGPDIQSPI